jgi:ABC-type sugar transport system ATPase subunit
LTETTLATLSRIDKTYPGVHALKGVDFEIKSGQIHCLVGENGAGKSTLMRILSGAEQPDAGTITIEGQTFNALDPGVGLALGVGVIYQELDLVPDISVAENIFLGHEPHDVLACSIVVPCGSEPESSSIILIITSTRASALAISVRPNGSWFKSREL